MPVPRVSNISRCRAGLTALVMALPLISGCDSAEEKAETYYKRGMATMAAGELDKAAVDFRSALKLKDNYTDALLGLAKVEEQRRNFDAAARIYLSVAGRDPRHLDSRVELAQLLLASRQVDAASTYAEESHRLAPADPRVLVIRAGVALSRGKREDAVRLANEALRIDPDNATAVMVLVSERVAASDRAGALAILEWGIARDDANLGLQLLKLRTLDDMGEQRQVAALYVRLSETFPNNPAFQDAMVTWYLAKGRNADAERAARHFALTNADDETAQIRLAMLISRTQGAPAAIGELKHVIARFPREDEGKRVALMIAQAQLEYGAGQQQAAVATLQDLIASTRDTESRNKARVQLAQTLAEMKQWQQATELSEAVLADDAGNADALAVRAASRMAAGNNALAIEDLNAALSEMPSSARLATLMGEAYEQMGRAVLAEEQYARALALSGYTPQSGITLARFLMRYGRSERAMQVLEDLRARGTADPRSLSVLARLKLDARDWTGAEELAGLLRNAPGMGETADQILAAALGGMNRQDEGIALLLSSLPQSRERQGAETELVRAYLRAGKLAEAEQLVRDRLRNEPADAQSQILLGSVLMAAGRAGEAAAAFKAAVASGDGSAHAALAQFHLRTGRLEEAERAARAGLAREAGNSALRLLLAEALEARGQFDGAIAEYEKLLQSDPASTVVANNLASLLSERRNDPKALERAFEIAIRFQNSDVPQFLDTLGWIHYLRSEHYAALPLLKRAAEKLPGSGAVQFHLGMVLKEVGEAERSATTLQRAVKLAPVPDAYYLQTAIATLEQLKAVASAN